MKTNKVVLFIDPVCNKVYDETTSGREALGGSEASLARVAEGLAQQGFSVVVAQHNRNEPKQSSENLLWFPMQSLPALQKVSPDYVIVFRDPGALRFSRDLFPKAKMFYWTQDLGDARLLKGQDDILDVKPTIICVSQFHEDQVRTLLTRNLEGAEALTVKHVYNMVDPKVIENVKEKPHIKKDKLMFFSAPIKGLGHTLAMFKEIRKELPSLYLYIANPGYMPIPDEVKTMEHVVVLGDLSHSEVIDHVAESFACLHLNNQLPETFGIVSAEANTVGTPVLTYDLGAASEILNPPDAQLIPIGEVNAAIDRLKAWEVFGRPQVTLNNKFRREFVLGAWQEVLR